MARKVYATAPDGTIVTRQTDRDYAFAVLAQDQKDVWGAVSFHGSYAVAQKSSNKSRALGYRPVIVPVTDVKPEATS